MERRLKLWYMIGFILCLFCFELLTVSLIVSLFFNMQEKWTAQYRLNPNAIVKFYNTWKALKPTVQPEVKCLLLTVKATTTATNVDDDSLRD